MPNINQFNMGLLQVLQNQGHKYGCVAVSSNYYSKTNVAFMFILPLWLQAPMRKTVSTKRNHTAILLIKLI
jgi:hypothetical protein